jgi:hypothetical protein
MDGHAAQSPASPPALQEFTTPPDGWRDKNLPRGNRLARPSLGFC